MATHSWDMRFGAAYGADGATRFRLWAPGADAVEIELDPGGAMPMAAAGDGWFATHIACPPGTAYRFRLTNGLTFPDPASRAQHDGVHGWSIVVDPTAYAWRHDEWHGRPWREAVIYEAHVGVTGGFNGVRRDLARIADLGITAIELMPIADFPGRRNWGYDGVLPFAVAGAYGSPSELKALIDAAHGLNLMVLLDVVYNHFGPDGNYLPSYAPSCFRADVPTPWGPAIAFDDPTVADFFAQNALYWLNEYRFDGLRLDAVHAILPHDALPALGQAIRAGVAPNRHVHLVLENERNDAALLAWSRDDPPGNSRPFDAQWNDDIHHCLHVLLTGESEAYYRDYADAPAERLARCLASGFAYQGEMSANLRRPRGTPSDGLPPTAFVAFVQNHDQIGNRALGERLTSLADPYALRAAIALILLCPQIPMIFMGEEIGTRSPFLFFTDHHNELADAVRKGRRNEFRNFAAFQDAAQRARIPDPNDEATFRASIPQPPSDGFDWSGFYRELIAVRARHVIPRLDRARSIAARVIGPAAVLASWRMADGAQLTIAANFGDAACALDAAADAQVIATTAPFVAGVLPSRATVALLSGPPSASR
jgi:maltooligosyltrehalose trehalohydrolase